MAMTTLWIATAAVVAGGGTTALATSGGSQGAKVLSQSEVRAELAAQQQKPADTVLRGAVGTIKHDGHEWAIKLNVGTVYLRCKGDQVTTFRAVGNPGYLAAIERVVSYFPTIGNAPIDRDGEPGVGATFVTTDTKPVEVKVVSLTCVDGKPVQRMPK
jgi:hypothetical protein